MAFTQSATVAALAGLVLASASSPSKAASAPVLISRASMRFKRLQLR